MYYETLKSSRQNYSCGSSTKLKEKYLEKIKKMNKKTTKWTGFIGGRYMDGGVEIYRPREGDIYITL